MGRFLAGILLALAGLAAPLLSGAEAPLTPEPMSDPQLRVKREQLRQAAEQAMRVGIYPLATRLYGQAREGLAANEKAWREVTLRLVDALLSQGMLEKAGLTLDSLEAQAEPRYSLRVAMLAFLEDRIDAAATALGAVNPDELPKVERPWHDLLGGMIAEARGQHNEAAALYQRARDQAVDAHQRARFESWIYRHRLLHGEVDDAFLLTLREQSEDFSGKAAGFTFAREYAMALYKRGREQEALAVLEKQLTLTRKIESEEEDKFLLLIALVSGLETEKARVALESLLRDGHARIWQRMALSLLLQQATDSARRAELGALLDGLIRNPADIEAAAEAHLLEDELLFARATLMLEAGNPDQAAVDVRRILDQFPGSGIYMDALRLMSALALARTPPQYRTAADYLNRMRERLPRGSEQARVGLLMGDCYYLNGDYGNAADVYAQVYGEHPGREWGEVALFQRVMALLQADQLERAEEVLDEALHGEQLPPLAFWQAEWNFLERLRKSGNDAHALSRTRGLLRDHLANVPAELALRLMWMEASLSMQGPEISVVPDIADNILALLENLGQVQLAQQERALMEASTLLLKAQALLRLNREEPALKTLERLRRDHPQSTSAIRSYIDEARHYAASGKLIEAQQRLIQLADKYPESPYAAIALYEAALVAEQQGLQRTYEEAVGILERLITRYPESELTFFARMRQGDLLRKLNQFGAAQSRYEELLRAYPEHPRRHEAQMALAYTLLAQARNEPTRLDPAVAQLERLYDLPNLPVALRVEAGFQWAHALQIQGKSTRAEDAYWQLLTRFLLEEEAGVASSRTGDYWLARALFELAALYEQSGRISEALKLYDMVLTHDLPGAATARARMQFFKDTKREQL